MMFAKLRPLFRQVDRRTSEEAWRGIGSLLNRFSPDQGAAYLCHADYGAMTA
jgi:hypothetical protein